MAGLLHASIPVRGSHDVYNHHSSEIYRPQAYESYPALSGYSPKQGGAGESSSLLSVLTPATDINPEVADAYSSTSSAIGGITSAYPMISSTTMSPYGNTNPPSLYAPNGVPLSNQSVSSYSYPFGMSAGPLFSGSSPFSPSYLGISQQDDSSPGVNGRGRNSRLMSNDVTKGNKKKVC